MSRIAPERLSEKAFKEFPRTEYIQIHVGSVGKEAYQQFQMDQPLLQVQGSYRNADDLVRL